MEKKWVQQGSELVKLSLMFAVYGPLIVFTFAFFFAFAFAFTR